ncbi:MAG TPA: methylated-DNA--[protein]-cysteine S-methyltransferase [Armatimonadota bacterium]|nr:methylated-DNA--[protein]-cysteine S-methyltransferase [Armatimonadota bacterium]HOS44191.1 methylated-DNA--[protein]-cysteine S-methyltransferase [Armatimonadota bacterium]
MDTCGAVLTPWGRLTVEVGDAGVRRVIFDGPEAPALTGAWAAAFDAYLRGEDFPAALPVDLAGVPPFTRRVLTACRAIPFGTVRTYRELAERLGCPRGSRAVGQALARNPVPVVIPCHRVMGANGALTGFLGGLAWKRALLAHEGIALGI